MPGPTTMIGQWWFTLDEFLARADRVLTSEIARRDDLATVGSTMRIIGGLEAGVSRLRIEREHPREADIESAATRIRPLFLKDDPVYWSKVTAALGGLNQSSDPEAGRVIKALKKAWNSFDSGYRWKMIAADPSWPAEWRSDRQIARDFLYGELVHADPDARRRLRRVAEGDRLIAATVWVADATRLTLATKQLTLDLTAAGVLATRPHASSDDGED